MNVDLPEGDAPVMAMVGIGGIMGKAGTPGERLRGEEILPHVGIIGG